MTSSSSDPTADQPRSEPLPAIGAIMAGGASRRFGSPKALAIVGGRTLSERVATPLRAVVTHPVLITGDVTIGEQLFLPTRPDELSGQGPLAGIACALRWARELGLHGGLCVACDLPFVTAPLLHAIAFAGLAEGVCIVPEGESRRGFEPLCAWYPVVALNDIDAALARGERSIHGVVEALQHRRLGAAELSAFGDPSVLFLNVNTPEAAAEADLIAMEPR